MSTATVLALAALSAGGLQEAPGIDLASLLEELADPRALAEHPEPSFRILETAGEEPRGVAAGERAERAEREWLRAEGPGALVRTWISPPVGTLRAYLDGHDRPAWVASLEELAAGAAARSGPLPDPLLVACDGAVVLQLPLPYRESCRLTWSPPAADDPEAWGAAGEVLRYRCARRAWDQGTPVTSFTAGQLERCAERVQALAGAGSAAGPSPAGRPEAGAGEEDGPTGLRGEITHPFGHRIGSTGRDGAAVYAGLSNDTQGIPSALTELRLVVRDGDLADAAGLGELVAAAVLVLTFDGVDTVRVPLADFFAWRLGSFDSRFLAVQDAGDTALLVERFPMPFRQSLFVRVEATRPEPMDLMGYVTIAPYEWTPATLYFHAGRWPAAGAPGQGTLLRPADDGRAVIERRGQWIGEGSSPAGQAEGSVPGLRLWVDAEGEPSVLPWGVGADLLGSSGFRSALEGAAPVEGAGSARFRVRLLDRIPFLARLDVEGRPGTAAVGWFYADLAPDSGSQGASITTPGAAGQGGERDR